MASTSLHLALGSKMTSLVGTVIWKDDFKPYRIINTGWEYIRLHLTSLICDNDARLANPYYLASHITSKYLVLEDTEAQDKIALYGYKMRNLYDCWFKTKDGKIRMVEMYAASSWQARQLVEKQYAKDLAEWHKGPNLR